MLLLREMQVEQKKPWGKEMAHDKQVVGAILSLKWLSNYHQDALEQTSEAGLWSTVDCCDYIRPIPGVKFWKCAAGKPCTHSQLPIQKQWRKQIRSEVCTDTERSYLFQAYPTTAAALLLHPPSCTLYWICDTQQTRNILIYIHMRG